MSMRLIVARSIVRAAAHVVPGGRRDEWRAEWDAELATLGRRTSGWRLVGFALGAVPHALAEWRQEWSFDALGCELRYALRGHLRNPSYAFVAALLIALGVGANTTVFTLVNAVLLRAPSGVVASDRLVQLGRTDARTRDARDFDNWSYPLFTEFRARNHAFADLAAYETDDAVIGGDADAERAQVQLVSPGYFRLLGATLSLGREFDDADGTTNGPAVVLGDALWRTRFGADPDVVGKTLRVRGTAFRIVGVAAPGFGGAEVGAARPDLWAPLSTVALVSPGPGDHLKNRGVSWLWVAGRLRPGVDVSAARAEMRALYRGIQLERAGQVREDIALVPGLGLRPEDRALANVVSAALMAMVAVVLLVACANLAALLLARGAAREAEIGVRLAVGAARVRVIRQLLFETAIVAAAGSVLAFVLTRWTARFVEWLMPYSLSVSIQPDARVLVFAVAIGVATSVAFGVVPALRATRVDLASLLRAGAVGVAGDRGVMRSGLLVAQIALSFVLIAAAGVLARSVLRANAVDPGFRTDDVLIGEVDLRSADSSSPDARLRRMEQLAERAMATPGVIAASLASSVPASGSIGNRSIWRSDDLGGRPVNAITMLADTGYFHMMRVPVLRGRVFDARDRPGATDAAIVNETLARRLWPNENAVGRELAFGGLSGQRVATVVGVARDTRNRSLRSPPAPQIYLPFAQSTAGSALLHVRVSPGAVNVSATLSADLRGLMPGAPPIRFEPARAWLARGYADVRLVGILGGAFGALALALAGAGIYGVVSYETARRRREFGIRLALGARASQVHRMVFARGARLSAVGVAIGVLAFAATAPLLGRWAFGVAPFDPLTLVAASGVLFAAAAIAAVGPAIRASRANPIDSLRAE